jgi:hypothetical protein
MELLHYRRTPRIMVIKHIDIQHHYIRELIHSGTITLDHVSSTKNLADLFTKPLPQDHHHRLLTTLNIN